jgi:hypothetical protein
MQVTFTDTRLTGFIPIQRTEAIARRGTLSNASLPHHKAARNRTSPIDCNGDQVNS